MKNAKRRFLGGAALRVNLDKRCRFTPSRLTVLAHISHNRNPDRANEMPGDAGGVNRAYRKRNDDETTPSGYSPQPL